MYLLLIFFGGGELKIKIDKFCRFEARKWCTVGGLA